MEQWTCIVNQMSSSYLSTVVTFKVVLHHVFDDPSALYDMLGVD